MRKKWWYAVMALNMLALSHREAAPVHLQLYKVGTGDVLHLLVLNLHRCKCGKLEPHITYLSPQPAARCL